MKTLSPQIQESQQIPSRINTEKTTPRNIRIRSLKISDKEKVLKEPGEQTQIMWKSKGENGGRPVARDDANHE